jgi:hypothetical protein
MTQRWISPTPVTCDVCDRRLGDDEFFIDGKTIYGPWGIMCVTCHMMVGVGLGTGKGQKYNVSDRTKVEG